MLISMMKCYSEKLESEYHLSELTHRSQPKRKIPEVVVKNDEDLDNPDATLT
jgi:hypothetical protein